MPSIKLFLVIQIIFVFSGSVRNLFVVEEHASASGGGKGGRFSSSSPV